MIISMELKHRPNEMEVGTIFGCSTKKRKSKIKRSVDFQMVVKGSVNPLCAENNQAVLDCFGEVICSEVM